MIKLGITGTREVPEGSYHVILDRLYFYRVNFEDEITEITSGGAKGVDQFVADACLYLFPNAHHRLVLPKNYDKEWVNRWYEQAKLMKIEREINFTELDPLSRNHVILNHTTQLEAFPAQEHEIKRSGTWATIRYARKRNIGINVNPLGE